MKYFLLYKPYGYLSQFTKENEEHKTLADLGPFPPDVYPVGRLDLDSEGLLLLTNDAQLNQKLLHPSNQHWRTYWVQVEGIPSFEAIQALQKGVEIKINKKIHHTLPAKAQLLSETPPLPDRDPPIRYRANIPDSWLELSLCEGKNRQVRRMCAKVGYPVLRLVRVRMEHLSIEGMQPGEYKELDTF